MHIKTKNVLKLQVCGIFFARDCVMGCLELGLALDSASNRRIWYYLSDY